MRTAGCIPLFLAACTILSCGGGPALYHDCPTVELRVHDTTCASADVSWSVWSVTWEDRGRNVMTLPWSHQRDLCTGEVEIWARRECTDDGIVTVEIYLDGRLERSSQGRGSRADAGTSLWID